MGSRVVLARRGMKSPGDETTPDESGFLARFSGRRGVARPLMAGRGWSEEVVKMQHLA